jgi:hypothetical protein
LTDRDVGRFPDGTLFHRLARAACHLDDSSTAALVVDKRLPRSSARLHEVLVETWPRLSERVAFVAGGLQDVEILPTDTSCRAMPAVV